MYYMISHIKKQATFTFQRHFDFYPSLLKVIIGNSGKIHLC